MEQIIPDTLKHPTSCETIKPRLQLMSPGASFSYNKNTLDEILHPQVDFVTSTDKLTLDSGSHDIKCLVTVRLPQIHKHHSKHHGHLKRQIVAAVNTSLARLDNWNTSIGFERLGDLLLVDRLSISKCGTVWDQVLCYFFTNGLLLVDGYLIGQVVVPDIQLYTAYDNTIVLALKNDNLPELQLHHFQNFVMHKWAHYIGARLRRNLPEAEIPLFHFTSTCWGAVDVPLPEDIVHFHALVERGSDIPNSLLLQAVPAPEREALNLIVALALSHAQSVVEVLQSIRRSLLPGDKLGLILVGVDSPKEASFTGCAEAQWLGWDDMIQVLRPGRTVSSLKQLAHVFDKAHTLCAFAPEHSRLLVVHDSNIPGPNDDKYLRIIGDKAARVKKHMAVDLVQIGTYTLAVLECQDILNQPVVEHDSMYLTYGNRTMRFDSYAELTAQVPRLVRQMQNCIPKVSVDITKVQRLGTEAVHWTTIEVHGHEQAIPESVSCLSLVIHGIPNGGERSVMAKMAVNTQLDPRTLSSTLGGYELPLVRVASDVSDEQSVKTVGLTPCHKRCSFDGPMATPTQAFPFDTANITPPHAAEYYPHVPLLPPLSTSKEQGFVKRQLELSVMDAMVRIARGEAYGLDETASMVKYYIGGLLDQEVGAQLLRAISDVRCALAVSKPDGRTKARDVWNSLL